MLNGCFILRGRIRTGVSHSRTPYKTMTKTHFPQARKNYVPRFFCLLAILFAFTVVPAPADEKHERQSIEVASESTNELGNPSGAAEEKPWIAPGSTLYKTLKYTGKFHVMVLHFPIAFLIGATVVQWYSVARGKGASAAAIMLWFGALGAVAAASLGWMYAYDSVYFSEKDIKLLFWHRWLGTGTATLAVILLPLRTKLTRVPFGIALTVCAGLVTAAAHFGASLVYGPDFLFKF